MTIKQLGMAGLVGIALGLVGCPESKTSEPAAQADAAKEELKAAADEGKDAAAAAAEPAKDAAADAADPAK